MINVCGHPLRIPMLLCLPLLLIGCQPNKPGATITQVDSSANQPTVRTKVAVAMASDLRFVSVELKREFERKNPDLEIEPTFGASGNLFAQISNQAPFDVFLSADLDYPRKLVDQGLAVPDSLFPYAVGHVVLWVRSDSPLPIADGVEILKSPLLKKLAIANPKVAPYGRAAEAALKKLRLYEDLKDKLVLGENVAQAGQFAESGAADAAIISRSLGVADNFVGKGSFWMFPNDSYPRMVQGAVIVKAAKQATAAQKWCDFLRSSAAQEIFKKFGFGLPEA